MVDDFEVFFKGKSPMFLKHLWNENFAYILFRTLEHAYVDWVSRRLSVIWIQFLDFVRFTFQKPRQ